MKRLGNHALAIGVASILALYASGVAVPALTALATSNNEDNDHNNDDNNHERHH
jgi:hypothetical protein